MLRKSFIFYIDSYRGLSKEMWLLSLVLLINRMGTMVFPFLMIYLTTQLGFSLSQGGIVMALFGIGSMFGAYIGGKLTDDFDFKTIQITSLIGGGIMFLIIGQLKSYYAICIAAFFLSLINEAFRPANAAAIGAYSSKENLTRSFTLNRLAFNLGWSIGGGLGGFIAAQSYELLFWVDGCTNIISGIIFYFILPSPKSIISIDVIQDTNDNYSSGFLSPLKDKVFVFYLMATTLYAICFFQLFTNLPAYLKTEKHFSEEFIGQLYTLNGLFIVAFEMALMYWISRKRHQLYAIPIGAFIHIIAYLCLVLFNNTYALVTLVVLLITISEMLALPVASTFWMSRTNSKNRGAYAGWQTFAWAFALTIGPPLVAIGADIISWQFVWWMIALLSLLVTIIYYKVIQLE
ncbi:MAG: MFS transporter [Chitinophagales bacterium]|nr:MFS transporter [Chitinophagales bacterium]